MTRERPRLPSWLDSLVASLGEDEVRRRLDEWVAHSETTEEVSTDIVAVLVIPVADDPGRLLAPGAPVYCVRDELSGWTVESTIGTTEVHAPTEGDGHLHGIEDAPWALALWWDRALAPEGWDRARRVYADNGWDPAGYDPECQADVAGPFLTGVESIADGLVRAGLASRVVRLVLANGRLAEVTS